MSVLNLAGTATFAKGSHKSRTTFFAAEMLARPFAGQVIRRGRTGGTAAALGTDFGGTAPTGLTSLPGSSARPWVLDAPLLCNEVDGA